MNPNEVSFRRMTVRDVDHVMNIEKASFTAPWSRNAFLGELTENHFAHYVVMTLGDELIGYGGMWVIIDEAHVTNIAVYPTYRGHKLGERLLRRLMAEAIAKGARKMTLEVRVTNTPAKGLYRKLGFEDGGIRKGYYTDNREDALVMYVTLPALGEIVDAME
ncbi:MAG: ribosomal protein S18-alanine N-acetyltransferase [Acidibacillus sp.]|uniref:Ribosomal-protein-alanine acetyltransferase n=1 Tax=Sulfoacidibacillus ferrooxidans TaxID=2005001 RepID=A0A9X1V9S5_9BACL|nr:ribosomal protein S18-alanine N-acetyltransferase [Sulfoacidibacillus ferrooxidans]MCI0183707.1 Ribosomal-protein-alanine acetyltransferase [Sulfoacidibacillus ferrooxidans]MCY0892253.1 ribosomal protein S18-alanine N-acetyltransferase [Acidibacillus sp.]